MRADRAPRAELSARERVPRGLVVVLFWGALGCGGALVDEGAEAGGESVGLGEVDVMAAAGPLFDRHVAGVLTKVVALVVWQAVSEDSEAWSIDPCHLGLDLCLQGRGVGAQQLLPVAEHHRLSDVLALEQ